MSDNLKKEQRPKWDELPTTDGNLPVQEQQPAAAVALEVTREEPVPDESPSS